MSVQNFESRLTDPSSRRFGTFSYLPSLTPEQVELQVVYMLGQGWTCAIEHVEPERAMKTYWYMWKLPMFGASSAASVLDEVDSCVVAHPGDHVRLVAYDARRQTRGQAIVVHRGV